ncbi:hypothetical protein Dshi_2527 [Dinoroseobacter shibae DFL 12 = DSM 16493]|uniref:Uncharacterized protein n=1 Tax=Dinoroseobacter shibae (strain DSM 16493 / NCIMB 14021 / DFL 12) TaxID=398580 RepID=A8LSR1_DINSH|nr:hypothetical protein Dshi_2527 [Dinoroseobacter shibae DFL 12 = DSM 16493]
MQRASIAAVVFLASALLPAMPRHYTRGLLCDAKGTDPVLPVLVVLSSARAGMLASGSKGWRGPPGLKLHKGRRFAALPKQRAHRRFGAGWCPVRRKSRPPVSGAQHTRPRAGFIFNETPRGWTRRPQRRF